MYIKKVGCQIWRFVDVWLIFWTLFFVPQSFCFFLPQDQLSVANFDVSSRKMLCGLGWKWWMNKFSIYSIHSCFIGCKHEYLLIMVQPEILQMIWAWKDHQSFVVPEKIWYLNLLFIYNYETECCRFSFLHSNVLKLRWRKWYNELLVLLC